MCRASCVVHSATTHALCWAFRTDNSGPPESMDEVFRQFDIARWQFPGANVFASTFDNFTAQLLPVAAALPVTTAEAGDTVSFEAAPHLRTKNPAPKKQTPTRTLHPLNRTKTVDDLNHRGPLEDVLLPRGGARVRRVPRRGAVRSPRPSRAGVHAHARKASRAHLCVCTTPCLRAKT
jgi:hypothetical protein